jgi:hypothetical protein
MQTRLLVEKSSSRCSESGRFALGLQVPEVPAPFPTRPPPGQNSGGRPNKSSLGPVAIYISSDPLKRVGVRPCLSLPSPSRHVALAPSQRVYASREVIGISEGQSHRQHERKAGPALSRPQYVL